jgi:hypothetical protein
MHHLRLSLWRRGYPIPARKVTETLEYLAFRPYRHLATIASRSRTPEDAAAEVATQYMADLPRSKLGRAVRRQLRNDAAVQQVLAAALQLGLGGSAVFSSLLSPSQAQPEQVAETFIRAMGLDIGWTAHIGNAGPWITSDPAQDLMRFEQQGLFSFEYIANILRSATEAELLQARADTDVFVPGMVSLVRLLAATGAPEVFGWFFKTINVEDDATIAQCIVMLLAARKLVSSTAMDSITDAMRQNFPGFLALEKLIAVDPLLARYLNPNTGQQAVLALGDSERSALQQRIKDIFDKHPDIAQAFTPLA